MSTLARYTPEAVSRMSDRELSEAVAKEVFGAVIYGNGAGILDAPTPCAYHDGQGAVVCILDHNRWLVLSSVSSAAVFAVLEHMRKRWKDAAPDPIRELDWYITGWSEYWAVGRHHCGASGADFPLHDDALVKHVSIGRAIFESALLASQDLNP